LNKYKASLCESREASLIFIKKYDIIYIESKGKEMINMKVIQVKAKVASSKLYTQEQMDSMGEELASCRNQIMGLKQRNAQLEEELNIEKKNHALMTAGMQMWQNHANEAEKELRRVGSANYWKEQYERSQKEGSRSISQMAEMLIAANEERDSAISRAADLNLEIMEREARITELEKRIAWLENEGSHVATIVS